jgi:hypothetical protein
MVLVIVYYYYLGFVVDTVLLAVLAVHNLGNVHWLNYELNF